VKGRLPRLMGTRAHPPLDHRRLGTRTAQSRAAS
jgi:hypothetical protein